MRRFEFRDDRSSKFWEIDRDEAEVTTRWGKLGTTGQSKTKDFGSADKAEAAMQKQIAKKTSKGYRPPGQETPESVRLAAKGTGAAMWGAEALFSADDSERLDVRP